MNFWVGVLFLFVADAKGNKIIVPRCRPALPPKSICLQKIQEVKPTQPELGFHEVDDKVREYSKLSKKEIQKLKSKKIAPAVIGPDGNLYLIDHHHTTLALEKVGEEDVMIEVVENWNDLARDEPRTSRMRQFWERMEQNHYCYLRDWKGHSIDPLDPKFPKSLDTLKDNPYRAVIKDLIEAKIVAEGRYPYYEFYVADALHTLGLRYEGQDWDGFVRQAKNRAQSDAGKRVLKRLRKSAPFRCADPILEALFR